MLGFLLAEVSNSKAVGKVRNYLQKWRPMRQALPAAETDLELIGYPRGPKFDKIVEEFFRLQLAGKGRTPEDRIKVLRKLSGIKEPPKKEEKEVPKKKAGEKEKPKKGAPGAEAQAAAEPAAAKAAPPERPQEHSKPSPAPAAGVAKKTPAKPASAAKPKPASRKTSAGKKRR